MLRYNILLFFRNIRRSKTTFFINFIGLTSGLTCCLLIYLWVSDEMNVDKFHEKDSQLYRMMTRHEGNKHSDVRGSSSALLADALEAEYPEIENAIRMVNFQSKNTLSDKDQAIKAIGIYADSGFFKAFSFPLIAGKNTSVLGNINNIVISKDLAEKLFGSSDDVVGNSIEINKSSSFQVSGVFENVPTESSLKFDYVLPYEMVFQHFPYLTKVWTYSYSTTFVLLKPRTDVQQFNKKVAPFLNEQAGHEHAYLFAKPYSESYLYGRYENGVQSGGRIDNVRFFSLIGLFILLIACINFMNLSTAHASMRMKEIGIRKTLGIKRMSLIAQFLIESTLLVTISLAVSILLTLYFLPSFNQITNKEIVLDFSPEILLFLGSITLLTGFVAGIYPAFYISGFNVLQALSGKLSANFSEFWVRKGLVVFQFTLSTILIVGVLVIYKQMKLTQDKKLGFDRENIIYISKEGRLESETETFISEVKKIPGVKTASVSSSGFFGGNGATSELSWPGQDPEREIITFSYLIVDYGMMELLNLEMKEGRTYSKEYGADDLKIIFNEAAVDAMGLRDPIGSTINLWGENKEIIGVAKNFHFQSLHEELKPMFIFIYPQRLNTIMVKLENGNPSSTISALNTFYTEFNPGIPFDYRFLDKDFEQMYASENRISVLSKYFAGLAIIISCLGLFGLAIFTAERRKKEIGIRKALGQGSTQISLLLSSEFAKLVIISIAIGLPIAYFLTKNWLATFAFSIDLGLGYFLLAGITALVVAMLTVSTQAIRAANMNPVDALREE